MINNISYSISSTMGSFDDNSQVYLSIGVRDCFFYGGKLYTMGTYDENGQESCVIDLSNLSVQTGGAYTHAWGIYGGYATCANSTYVYQATRQSNLNYLVGSQYPPNDTYWWGVTRKNRSNMSLAGGFTGATGFSGAFKITYIDSSSVNADIIGMACSETELFISDPFNQRILVLDANTMAETNEHFFASGLGDIEKAADGHIWAIIGNTVQKIHKDIGSSILTINCDNTPQKLFILSDGSLCIADSAYQVKIYDPTGTYLKETYGVAGGVSTNLGLSEGARFGPIYGFTRYNGYTYVLWGYVPDAYGVTLSKHDADGNIVDKIYSFIFIECPDFNENGTEIHSRYNKIANNKHYLNLDINSPASNFLSAAFTTHTYYRRFGGKKFLYDIGQTGNKVSIREIMPNTHINRAAGYYQRNISSPSLIWRPRDAGIAAPNPSEYEYDLSTTDHLNIFPDAEGTLWRIVAYSPYNYLATTMGIERMPCTGFDQFGNPIYSWANNTREFASTILDSTDSPRHFFYDVETDTAYISYWSASRPEPAFTSRLAGSNFKCINNWMEIGGTRSVRWVLQPAYSSWNTPMSIAFDGDLFSLGYCSSSKIEVYNAKNGDLLGTFSDSRNVAWIDSNHGHRIKQFSAREFKILCMKEIGGAAYLINGTSDFKVNSSTAYEIFLKNNYFLVINGSRVYIRVDNVNSYELTLSSAKGNYVPIGTYRDVTLTNGGVLRIDSNGNVGYATNPVGRFLILFDSRTMYLSRN